jgi:hypothetical protein
MRDVKLTCLKRKIQKKYKRILFEKVLSERIKPSFVIFIKRSSIRMKRVKRDLKIAQVKTAMRKVHTNPAKLYQLN